MATLILSTVTLTRPANTTAYSANDAVTDTNGEAKTVNVVASKNLAALIEAIRIRTADTGPGSASAQWEAYLYSTEPTPAADNDAFTAPPTGFIGRFIGSFMALTNGSAATLTPAVGSARMAYPATDTTEFYIIFKTVTAFTSSANSTTFDITVEAIQGA